MALIYTPLSNEELVVGLAHLVTSVPAFFLMIRLLVQKKGTSSHIRMGKLALALTTLVVITGYVAVVVRFLLDFGDEAKRQAFVPLPVNYFASVMGLPLVVSGFLGYKHRPIMASETWRRAAFRVSVVCTVLCVTCILGEIAWFALWLRGAYYRRYWVGAYLAGASLIPLSVFVVNLYELARPALAASRIAFHKRNMVGLASVYIGFMLYGLIFRFSDLVAILIGASVGTAIYALHLREYGARYWGYMGGTAKPSIEAGVTPAPR